MKIIESDFEYHGYRCITLFISKGYRCGYVGIPQKHPLYGKDLNSQINVTGREFINDKIVNKIGNRSPLSLWGLPNNKEDKIGMISYFKIHGGISYTGGGENSNYPVESNLWWIGFDCGHSNDAPDIELLEKLWGDSEEVKYQIRDLFSSTCGKIRNKEYVEWECKVLVDQIIHLVQTYYS